MDDLIGLVFIIIFAVINVLAQSAKKKRQQGAAPVDSTQQAPRKPASSLESFLESLTEKFEPKAAELPDWPEGYERPNYVNEMKSFESEKSAISKKEPPEIIPFPAAMPELERMDDGLEMVLIEPASVSVKSVIKSMPAMIVDSSGMRIKSTSMLKSSASGKLSFSLKDKAVLRKAMIANIVFSPPRAYDKSFDNSIMK